MINGDWMRITKTHLGNLVRRYLKELNMRDVIYYGGFTCCRTCFLASIPEDQKYLLLLHGLQGMNYESPRDFSMEKTWNIAWSNEIGLHKIRTLCDAINADLMSRDIKVRAVCPENEQTTIAIVGIE